MVAATAMWLVAGCRPHVSCEVVRFGPGNNWLIMFGMLVLAFHVVVC